MSELWKLAPRFEGVRGMYGQCRRTWFVDGTEDGQAQTNYQHQLKILQLLDRNNQANTDLRRLESAKHTIEHIHVSTSRPHSHGNWTKLTMTILSDSCSLHSSDYSTWSSPCATCSGLSTHWACTPLSNHPRAPNQRSSFLGRVWCLRSVFNRTRTISPRQVHLVHQDS